MAYSAFFMNLPWVPIRHVSSVVGSVLQDVRDGVTEIRELLSDSSCRAKAIFHREPKCI